MEAGVCGQVPHGVNKGQLLWEITYPHSVGGEDTEELTMKQLAEGLALAVKEGCE